jgi:hypothetical protein
MSVCVVLLAFFTRATTKGGPQLPIEVLEYTRPLDLSYHSNNFKIESGTNNLRFFKLRESSGSTNCVATCCHTTMMVDHPAYQKKAVLLFPDVLKQTKYETEPIDFSFYG